MKAILNVDGKQLEVTSISYYKGEVASVQTSDENGVFSTYYHESNNFYVEAPLIINLNEALEFPFVEESIKSKFTELIKHLEEVIVDEDSMLTHLAISAMDEVEDVPFGEQHLLEKQKEFKLMQQRVMGVIDTVEEVKAYMEGWYRDDDDATAVEA